MAWTDSARPRFVPQRALPPGFRVLLTAEMDDAYEVSDPRELPPPLRTERWQALCNALDGWDRLGAESKLRLCALLHSMGFYDVVISLAARSGATGSAELVFWGASARYMAALPEKTAHYAAADMSAFEQIALRSQHAAGVRFDATAMVFVHKAKTGAPVQALREWHRRYETVLGEVTAGVTAIAAALYTSRFFRGSAFLPQRLGDKAGVQQAMDLAERHALDMAPRTPAEEHLRLENLHALMESRTKEALWLGDKELALARARKVVEVDPGDAKAWMELGEVHYRRAEWRPAAEAYATAALLGPPASAPGRHMAGLCLRKAGDERLAAFFFKDTLEVDPLAASPFEQIDMLADSALVDLIKSWARSNIRL